jgi:CSLREA domain-containing protein
VDGLAKEAEPMKKFSEMIHRHEFRQFSRLILGVILLSTLLLISDQPTVSAAVFVVDSSADKVDINPGDGLCATDTGTCTLRAAIQEANALAGTDTINVNASPMLMIAGKGEDAAATGDLDITDDLILVGTGGTRRVDGFNTDRVFHILGSVTVNMSNLEIRGGDPGGIANQGTLTLEDSTVTNNNGSGISNSGDLTLTTVTISDNDTPTGSGAGLNNNSTASLDSVTIVGNMSILGSGGGIRNDTGAILEIVNSTLDSNSAGSSGGGILTSGTLTIANSTISGNGARDHGGGINVSGGTVTLSNVTITNNRADSNVNGLGEGGGIYNSGGDVRLQNTILAGNTRPMDGPDCFGTLTSWGYNLIEHGHPDCVVVGDPTGNIFGQPSFLAPLGDNGSSTETHALLPGSMAIDGGNPGGCTDHLGSPLTTDQRGSPRVGNCDIGAFELQDELHHVYLPCAIRIHCAPAFRDDFSDPQSGWPVDDLGDIMWEYSGGEFRTLIRSSFWWAGARPGLAATDFRVNVEVRNATGVYGAYGLFFGGSADWSEMYVFAIDPLGYYAIYHKDGDTWSFLANGWSGLINHGTATNRLQVIRQGLDIDVYANGHPVVSVTDSSYVGSRYVGVIALSFDDPNLDIYFDNFEVHSLVCGQALFAGIHEALEWDAAASGASVSEKFGGGVRVR